VNEDDLRIAALALAADWDPTAGRPALDAWALGWVCGTLELAHPEAYQLLLDRALEGRPHGGQTVG
jgi:hypothetical protein